MANTYFQFKRFTIHQDRCAMKVTTDASLFGAWLANKIKNETLINHACLDIGTGTALLCLMYAQKNNSAIIDTIEIDEPTYQQANENVSASPFYDRINLIHDDAKTFLFKKKYNVIFSNPPFYENEIRSENQKLNIAHHSQELSLKQLFGIIKANLTEDGFFFVMLPYKRHKEINELLGENSLTLLHILFVRQSVNHDYFRVILWGKSNQQPGEQTIIDEISICDSKQQYTKGFVSLLEDFYLHL